MIVPLLTKPKVTYIKCGGSYQLVKEYRVNTLLFPEYTIEAPRLKLDTKGILTISDGYCWDGCSGPVLDRKTNMRAGLVHDALYEIMRKGLLPYTRWREADVCFGNILKEDGAWNITIKIDMAGLRIAKGKYANPKQRKERYFAP